MKNPLENYRQLLSRIDDLCRSIAEALGKQITCSAGCSSCCASITIFPVEAAALQAALAALPPAESEDIRLQVRKNTGGKQCPLLVNHRCLLYHARPIICRTHGLPIVYTVEGQRRSDCCPRNPLTSTPLSGAHVIDLDRLNTLLVAVNALYLRQSGAAESALRLNIAEVIVGCSSD